MKKIILMTILLSMRSSIVPQPVSATEMEVEPLIEYIKNAVIVCPQQKSEKPVKAIPLPPAGTPLNILCLKIKIAPTNKKPPNKK
jgi:hypothetical protein